MLLWIFVFCLVDGLFCTFIGCVSEEFASVVGRPVVLYEILNCAFECDYYYYYYHYYYWLMCAIVYL